MAIIVLNEWIFHDMLGENGLERQMESAAFINSFLESGDILVMPEERRWREKASVLLRLGDPRLRFTVQQFLTLLGNRDRTINLHGMEDAEIPPDLLVRLPEEDIYLVRAYVSAGADLLVTTDSGLYDSLAGSDVAGSMRDEFLSGYGRIG